MLKSNINIKVCMGTGGVSAGGAEVIDALKKELVLHEIDAHIEKNCSIHQFGCRGLCAKDVLVDVIMDDMKTTYQFIKPDMVPRLVKEHLLEKSPVEEWLIGGDYHNFHAKQYKFVLSDCGSIDPEDIDAYIQVNGYVAAKKVLTTLTPPEVINIIKLSGLRGRGGAGFPTGVKWELAHAQETDHKYLVCNADEGDPGAFMDRRHSLFAIRYSLFAIRYSLFAILLISHRAVPGQDPCASPA